MADSRLDAAIAALRESTSGSGADEGATEKAILSRVARPKVRPFLRFSGYRWGMALVLASSSVWAISGPVKSWLGEVTSSVTAPGGANEPPKSTKAPRAHGVPSAPVERLEPETKSEPPAPEEPSAPAEAPPIVPAPERAASSAEAATPATAQSASVRPSIAEELAVYRAAFEAHQRAPRSASTLALWDGYLARYPAGTFAPEARFHRAICLLQMGRKSQARIELEVFARGSGYRKREALELLAGLEGSAREETPLHAPEE